MEVNFIKYHSAYNKNVNRTAGSRQKELLDRLNSNGYTQIGDLIILNDGTSLKANKVPKLDIGSLSTIAAKNNVMDFGSANYFKYTNSEGRSLAIFSMPRGGLCRPMSESIVGHGEYDRETERYIHFWNNLKSGHALFAPPGWPPGSAYGYSNDDIRSYLDEAGISKGFFSVKSGIAESEFFYSNSEHQMLYRKDEYDLRYYTMTSSDFSYDKSVFRGLEPGTEIPIAGEIYILKDDLTLDIPYGIDIYDIKFPKYTHTSKIFSSIDCKA